MSLFSPAFAQDLCFATHAIFCHSGSVNGHQLCRSMTRQTRNITVAIRAFTIGNYEQRTRASSKSYAQLATACTTVRSKGYCIVVELLAIDGKQGLRRLNLALAHAQERAK